MSKSVFGWSSNQSSKIQYQKSDRNVQTTLVLVILKTVEKINNCEHFSENMYYQEESLKQHPNRKDNIKLAE